MIRRQVMAFEDDLPTERTPLLRTQSNGDDEVLAADKPNPSPFEISRTQLIIGVGFTWLASFLAALGRSPQWISARMY